MNSPFQDRHYLTDGGIETDLIYHRGFELPHFSAVMLMRTPEGREGLADYFRSFLDVATAKQSAFLLESPTWRASRDWIDPLGITESELIQLNRDSIGLMKSLRDEYSGQLPEILISGCLGPRGDGCLPTGMPLGEAIAAVDKALDIPPVHYMINCAHPSHFMAALDDGEDWLDRLGGLRTNASKRSHAELNEAQELDEGDPDELGELHTELARKVRNLRVVGGCCGTDSRHIDKMADGWRKA